jgi:DNA replication protein DnaC
MPTADVQEEIDTWRRMQRIVKPEVRLKRGNIPQHRRTPLADLLPRRGQEVAYADLVAYSEWFYENWKSGAGMTLVGPHGTGKTTLACALAVTLATTWRFAVAFTTLDRYIRGQQRVMSLNRLTHGGDQIEAEARQEIGEIMHEDWVLRRGAYLVVIDDVGREYRTGSGWAAQEFDSLLRERYDMGLPTIITTNTPIEQWSEEYSIGMRSFAREACPVVTVDG